MLILTTHIPPFLRPEEADWQAGGGGHAGRDEGGEEEDGHGEEGVHSRTLPFSAVPPTNDYFHPVAAVPAAVWGQCSELHHCVNI